MNKIFIFLILVFSNTYIFSQITITTGDGTPINNGDVIIFNSDGNEANLVTLVKNNSSSQIELKLKSVSITGTHGQDMEFCIGTCYYGMTEGTVYPTGTAHYYLDAGATSGENDIHFHHHIQTGDPDVTEYVLKIYENGNEANNFVQFTYKYDANYVGIENIDNSLFSIYPNPATKFFSIKTPEQIQNGEIQISNILGKTFLNIQIKDNITSVKTDKFLPGIYFVSIISNGKIINTKKLIIKK